MILNSGKCTQKKRRRTIRVNAYERAPKVRLTCLNVHGYRCSVYDLDFKVKYGKIGEAFIHVHQLKPLAMSRVEDMLDPVKELRPVCPDCHAIAYRSEPVMTIKKLNV